jgi:hypothetical protein
METVAKDVPDIATESVPDTLKALAVNPDTGLTRAEVDIRRKAHGYNEVAETREHPVLRFLSKFWDLSAWMLELISEDGFGRPGLARFSWPPSWRMRLCLAPLPWWQMPAILGYAMFSCLVVNDALKVAMIRWRVPLAAA